ncbi:TPMT family class I SAM-dependent methyltransferase [Algoriphagus halophytocola]|uniref:TPMT family class I SAM-dependent methyltransferase n=1 Tax=Algoriphagus halophytocola TaxID=2991499 RepID=A0ABY6MFL1_9BACT|nr:MULTISPECIES: TPMT family class I SAM-dependent methyltransferase [unclassified Algoriphagus]UZD22428.1 TPMT family class I SAM-dependent methyltransferase [Algoriphagus sp. TR-M5]WBL43688.1 TPMT family class I SAM-dependent methyltransferase [Algoriphagus sp. TR-M9]
MTFLDEDYWTDRYTSGKTGWDIGFASPPIVQYLDQIENKAVRILFPGAGNGFEANYAFRNGFSNVFLLDISIEPLQRFKVKNPDFPEGQVLHQDFFDHQGAYDLILEQTFFCALEPKLRPKYAAHMRRLLKPGGKLVGVWFDREFEFDGPPFGGSKAEYEELFQSVFEIKTISPCYNSIPERMGSEVFLIMENSKLQD